MKEGLDKTPLDKTVVQNCRRETIWAETIDALRTRVRCHDHERAGRRLTDAIVRGATAGLVVRGGLHLASSTLRLLRPSRGTDRGKPDVWDMIRDTLRWGAFLGSFSGVFVTADEAIACLFGHKRTAAWRALVAGALAGPTLLLTGRNITHTSLALYVLLRGITLLIRCGNLPEAARWKRILLTPTRWPHGDVLLMCISTAQLGYSWIVLPSTLPASYVRFLNKHGGKDIVYLNAVREMCQRYATGGQYTVSSPLDSLKQTRFKAFSDPIPCGFLHPGSSCNGHTIRFLPEAYARALPVYLPVYIVPAILVHRNKLLSADKAALELWVKVIKGALRSSAFLALYCALAWRGACTGFQMTKVTSGPIIAASCWVAGLATLAEKKSRRMELALYCSSRAIEAFALTMVSKGWVSSSLIPRRLDVIMFSLATAAICHCYSDHYGARRDVFKSKYLAVFDFILGNTGFESAGVQHVPSNGELLLAAGHRLEVNAAALLRGVKSAADLVGLYNHGHPAVEKNPTRSASLGEEQSSRGTACPEES